jgi:hypothetical protein
VADRKRWRRLSKAARKEAHRDRSRYIAMLDRVIKAMPSIRADWEARKHLHQQ